MKTYRYDFQDGFFCYYAGKPSKIDLYDDIQKHGKVVKITIC